MFPGDEKGTEFPRFSRVRPEKLKLDVLDKLPIVSEPFVEAIIILFSSSHHGGETRRTAIFESRSVRGVSTTL